MCTPSYRVTPSHHSAAFTQKSLCVTSPHLDTTGSAMPRNIQLLGSTLGTSRRVSESPDANGVPSWVRSRATRSVQEPVAREARA